MRREPHALIGGAVAGVVAAHTLGMQMDRFDAIMIGVIAGGIGANIPDIDQRWAPRYKPKSGGDCRVIEHRGPTHALIVVWLIMWTGLLFSVGNYVNLLAVGYLSHLVVDGISYQGVPYLWPLIWKRYRLLPYGYRLKSGSTGDWFVTAALVAASAVVLRFV